jgi:outer membrane protein
MIKPQALIRPATLFALYATSSFAQLPSQPLTLNECVRRAEAAQSTVTIARQQAEIAHYARVQATANFLPQASMGGFFGFNSPLLRDRNMFSYISANGIREYSALGNIGLEVDTSGRLRAQLSRAKADQDAAGADIILSQRDLRRAVAASFYRLTLARKLIQVARDNLAEAQSFESRNRLLVENQEAAQADLVKASAQAAFFEQAVSASELEAKLANHELASFWTQGVEGELSPLDILEDPMPEPQGSSPSESPFLRRPEFRLFDAQLRGFQADARQARAGLFPQLSLVQQYGVDSTQFSFADRGYATFVHLNVPVFDWFRARSASRQFTLQASQVDTNRQIATRTFSKEYRDALARIDLVYSQIAITEKQVKLSQDNLRLSRVRYEGGEGTALDVVAAQGQLAQARANYFTAKANYLNARVELEVTAGR